MNNTLQVKYYLKEGVMVTADGIPEEDFENVASILPNKDGCVRVGGHDKKKIQFIPVRSIILVEGVYEQQSSKV